MKDKIIGIVGGVGPYAGFDLSQKILSNTLVENDNDHISQVSLSFPAKIPDRTAFLTNKSDINPAYGVVSVIKKLIKLDAEVIGIACNQAHSPLIFSKVTEAFTESDIEIVNMIESTAKFIKNNFRNITRIGVLGRTGTYLTKIYDSYLSEYNISVIDHGIDNQYKLDDSIANSKYGIKNFSNPPTQKTLEIVNNILEINIKRGAELIILGCTELPLILKHLNTYNIPIVDTNVILARALITKAAPHKLKQYTF